MSFCIYIIQNKINNKIYIGQTNDFSTRKSHHKSAAFNSKYKDYNGYLYNSIRKYGWDNFIFTKIYECDTLEEINDAEEFFITFLGARNKEIGYNVQFGGGNTKKTERHKLNIALAVKGENNGISKLKDQQIIEILEKFVYGNYYLEDLAKEYNVCKDTICSIVNKKKWNHLSQNYPIIKKIPPAKNIGENSGLTTLTNEEVIKIVEMHKTGKYKYAEIAVIFNVSKSTIGNIIRKITWKHITNNI